MAGFVCDEIPTVDPLDSNVEWCEMPTMRDLPTMRTLSQLAGEDAKALYFVEEKKKSKSVRYPRPQFPGLHFFCWLCVFFVGMEADWVG